MTNRDSYGNEDQNTAMELIDSRDWPADPQTKMDTEDYIERYVAQVNQLRRDIETCARNGQDAGELIQKLATAEAELDKWIGIRVQSRKNDNKQLPF